MATQFPVEYLTALDEVVEQDAFSQKYQVQGAEFTNAKTVKVPELVFDEAGLVDYDRFETEGSVELNFETYTLDQDKQKVFYVDAVEDIDEQHVRTTNTVSAFERQFLVPAIDTYFFGEVKANAGTTANADITTGTIKAELRKAREAMIAAGASAADLYIKASALSKLEDAIDRQFAGEGVITDVVGQYNMFTIYLVPDERMGDLTFAVVAPNAIRHIWKRQANYLFEPGEHTQGDGWLCQMRWVYGAIAYKNKRGGIYVSTGEVKDEQAAG